MFSDILSGMGKIKYIVYGLLWAGYLFFSFVYFPIFNVNVAISSLGIHAVGAWVLGIDKALVIVLLSMPYHFFLLDYYGDILDVYQAKAFGYCAPVLIVYLIGSLKAQKDQLTRLSLRLDEKVTERTIELNSLIMKLINNDEHSRQSLGQDIHDSLGQNLTGLLLYSSLLQEQLNGANFHNLQIINEIIADIDRSLILTRKISRTLFPFKQVESSFEAAVDEVTSYYTETNSVRFDIQLDGTEQLMNDHDTLQLYRIVHESILNSTHYETPSLIKISLKRDLGMCCLKTQIDGLIKPQNIVNNMFVELMRYRAQLLNGSLHIKVRSDNSVVVGCCFPCKGSSVEAVSKAV